MFFYYEYHYDVHQAFHSLKSGTVSWCLRQLGTDEFNYSLYLCPQPSTKQIAAQGRPVLKTPPLMSPVRSTSCACYRLNRVQSKWCHSSQWCQGDNRKTKIPINMLMSIKELPKKCSKLGDKTCDHFFQLFLQDEDGTYYQLHVYYLQLLL